MKINNNIEITNEDNMQLMARYPDNHFEWACIDPPYGLGNRLSDGGGKLKNTPMAELYRDKEWDKLPEPKYWKEVFRVSKNQIVFGANYFMEFLPSSRGIVCWDKKQAMPTLSACELVWTSLDKPSKIMIKSSTDLKRFHPTQKPEYIYQWMFKYCKMSKNDKILDTHLGSGSIAVAIHKTNQYDKMNLSLVACELDKDYYDKTSKRLKRETAFLSLF